MTTKLDRLRLRKALEAELQIEAALEAVREQTGGPASDAAYDAHQALSILADKLTLARIQVEKEIGL